MKKLYSLLIMAVFCLTASSQTNPNRLIVHDTKGGYTGFLAERVDSLSFIRLDGRVAADVEFKGYTPDNGGVLSLSVTRTADCEGFRIDVIPKNNMAYLADDMAVAQYFDRTGGDMYYQDFTNAELTGFSFKDNTEYSVITCGYDRYGIACSSSRADFKTPRKPVVGNPDVAWTLKDVGTDRFTMEFVPNGDVKAYAICLFGKGEAEEQFNMWGPMMGFDNIGDMIRQFSGSDHTGVYENTWKDLEPDKEYEVYIQAWDVNGTYADMIVAPATTKAQGGVGVAEVDICIGEFGGDAAGGYWQRVIFTPNSETALYRAMLIEKAAFESPEWGEAGITDYLQTDRPEDPFWNLYGTDDAKWNSDPDKAYIAFAMAKNINGEWGPLSRKEYTTPKKSASAVSPGKVASRRLSGTESYGRQAFRMMKPAAAKTVRLSRAE